MDPGHVGGHVDDPQSWNAYAYARNNPLRFVDPTGLAYQITSQDGISTISDAAAQQMLADIISGLHWGYAVNWNSDGTSGQVAVWQDGRWVLGFSFRQVSVDRSPISELAHRIAETAGPGVDLALAAGAPSMALAAWATGAPAAAAVGRQMLARQVASRSISSKIARQMASRGWTSQMISRAISRGTEYPAINFANGNPAERFVDPVTGLSVVVDLVTKAVIQVGRTGFRWHPYR